uniref:Brain tumor protein n=1 Tax=Aceria tosichella TaxID=561515 RepID=A0A6G1S6N1_9ACAR
MGPTTPPGSDNDNNKSSSNTTTDLQRLLELKDQEIRSLKYELEKYKLALRQSQLDKKDTSLLGFTQPDTVGQQMTAEKQTTSQLEETAARVVFKTGIDDDDDDDDNETDDLDDIGEIDLSVELEKNRKKGNSSDNNDGEEDIISDGLLTSLTDAAISNLSQLAALQERCESQQHPHRQSHQQEQASSTQSQSQLTQPQVSSANLFISNSTIVAANPEQVGPQTESSSSCSLNRGGGVNKQSRRNNNNNNFNIKDPFSASNLANQAALAISAAAAVVSNIESPSSVVTHSSSGSVSPNSTIQPDLSTSHTLASAVAAAAAAAASDQQQQQHHDSAHQLQSSDQSARLISSALPSPEFFQTLHQQTSSAHQMSPLSSIHFSPSTSIAPSPSTFLAQSCRSNSNTSSSFMSSISSPNYLRRRFAPDRLPMMSPSPTSLTTGTSSAASTSLAHILQQHQQIYQQRSASALAGPITSASSTPISGTGSNVVSPLIGSKNSSQMRLNNMQIRHKFGYLGSGRGQFNSPHGFCLGLNQEIVVADTNNHRVCIFDKSGTYITQFGSPGKEEGQLWNPRKVAILHKPTSGVGSGSGGGSLASSSGSVNAPQQRQSLSTYSSHFTSSGGIQQSTGSSCSGTGAGGNSSGVGNGAGSGQFAGEPLYVVCDRGAERSRMQLFTKDGVFIKKIGIHYIDIVAGLAITQNGLIIVVDSVSPTVYIINAETGTLNGWFDCSGHMKEPSDIAVKSDVPGNEYFICDFKGHCVVVFSEQGEYLRRIGHDGLTSYPNGIDISDDGDILVGDSHGNRFHVVVFDRNGNFVSQFECPHVKVSRCCGLKITREGYIVTLAKNNHHVLVLDTIHI